MKSKIIFVISILLAFGILAVRAQDSGKQQQTTAVSAQQGPEFLPGDPQDPKLTPAQKELLMKAGENNPSKPVLKPDPRSEDFGVDPETYAGSSNAKPAVTSDAELRNEIDAREARMKEAMQPVAPASPITPANNDQPKGKPAEDVINYRNIKGPDDQPKPQVTGNVTNYREISGPNEQPLGTQPKK